MRLEDSNRFASIAWVREPLGDLLLRVRQGLETAAEGGELSGKAQNQVAPALSQLGDTFVILGSQGASMLAREMLSVWEQLFAAEQDKLPEDALSALMRAAVIIDSYLDGLETGHTDLPLVLLPILNDLRASVNAPLMSEGVLFSPDLEKTDIGARGEPLADQKLQNYASEVRSRFEAALLSWLSDAGATDSLADMADLAAGAAEKLPTPRERRLWAVASILIRGLQHDVVESGVSLRRLFARLDLYLRSLIRKDEIEPAQVDSLTRALLFYAATAKPGFEPLDQLREQYELAGLVPDSELMEQARSSVAGHNRDLFNALKKAILSELEMVKDQLDLSLRTGKLPDTGQPFDERLLKLADTLNVLGVAETARRLQRQGQAWQQTRAAEVLPEEPQLLALAEDLLNIESHLDAHITALAQPRTGAPKAHAEGGLSEQELQLMHSQLLNECLAELQLVRDYVRDWLSGDLSEASAANAGTLLGRIQGALTIQGDIAAARAVDRLRDIAAQFLAGDVPRQKSLLNNFADAIAALELYLVARRDLQPGEAQMLSVLDQRLDSIDSRFAAQQPKGAKPSGKKTKKKAKKSKKAKTKAAATSALDQDMLDIFLEEFELVHQQLQELLPQWLDQTQDQARLVEIRRGFHTLKGSGRMVGAAEIGEFSWQLEHLLNRVLEGHLQADGVVTGLAQIGLQVLLPMRTRLQGKKTEPDEQTIQLIGAAADGWATGDPEPLRSLYEKIPAEWLALLPQPEDLDSLSRAPEPVAKEQDATLLELIQREVGEHLQTLKAFHQRLQKQPGDTIPGRDEIRAAHTIAGTMGLAPMADEAEVFAALEDLLEAQRSVSKPPGEAAGELLAATMDLAQARLDHLGSEASDQTLETGGLKASLQAITDELMQLSTTDLLTTDPELLRIFLEEAREVLERSDSQLNLWRSDLSKRKPVANLQRELHTLKGSARMAGLISIGDIGHVMESLLENISEGGTPADGHIVDILEQGCDQLLHMVELLGAGQAPPKPGTYQDLINEITRLTEQPAVTEHAESAARAAAETADDSRAITDQPVDLDAVLAEATIEIPEQPQAPQLIREMPELEEPSDSAQGTVRVSADLLNELVNYAGEISIYRSRLDQQINAFHFNLTEVNQTVMRLRDQLRKMEIETEAQILSRFQREAEQAADDFDPLELDRFSTMQQLSRGLAESVSDLINLEEMLDDTAQVADTLLLQQSRVNTELQEGLMQTRMVPFATLAPRFRRVVRQAGSEAAKKVRLLMQLAGGSDGQLDRNVLERITAPMEHILRNAVAHGIESPAQRQQQNKDPEGLISITVENEATELVIRVEDDGAGIDLEAIRKAAIKKKLLKKNQKVSDQTLMEFILESGFTTADEVTELAGRGVGMDVVNNELKQIGGSVDIHSGTGSGTEFVIRIPFTLAVMQAITVAAGDREFAIPLPSVRGVAKLSPSDYRQRMEQDDPGYEFAGNQYPMLELAPQLGFPLEESADEPVSLLMIRAGDQRGALHVAHIFGHREIVIKPVGPQISAIPGILGGTITGDGEVMIILDMGPLIRRGLSTAETPVAAEAEPAARVEHSRTPLIMVVDDSITMRKVTSRVLENSDYEVITAKDGLDAVEQMMERIPDVMLLDIEMPRMDGYELAEYMSGEPRLKDIPIIMITSRTGQKHRDRARELGVERYLTKPYQESELLQNVSELLQQKQEPSD